jgi:hypothetical protein
MPKSLPNPLRSQPKLTQGATSVKRLAVSLIPL